MPDNPAIGPLFAFFGAAMLVGDFVYARRRKRFFDEGGHTTGRVVEVIQRRYDSRRGQYAPRIEFHDAAGKLVTFTADWGSTKYAIGAQIPVAYSLSQSWQAQVDTFANRWGIVIGIGGLGAMFLGAGLVLTQALF